MPQPVDVPLPVIGRAHRIAARAWLALAVGGGCAFVARDLFELCGPAVVLVWVGGALLGFFGLGGR
jgi:hypothetical protein